MSCFPCFSRGKSPKAEETTSREINATLSPERPRETTGNNGNKKEDENKVENGNIAAQIFTFRELATATKNFRPECLLGEGGFGRVYKATIESSGQTVAVKQLDRNGLQGNKEFLVEVLMLSLLHHPNLVNLIGYCADGEQRLLVYEYMSGGSVEDHIFDIENGKKPLDWFTRMKIASGAASGLEYLHEKANPPVIYRDFKSSNILLDEEFNPKLSDFGLAKLGSAGDKIHVSSRVMGTYGYCAPEYARTGQLTLKSDVFSFGVVLLELITGRRVIDTTRPIEEQNLVAWAQPIFKDPKRFPDMADPLLKRQFPERGLNQAVAIASMCLQEEATVRPLISDIVMALSFLSVVTTEGFPTSPPPQITMEPPRESCAKEVLAENKDSDDDDDDDDDEEEKIQSQKHRSDHGSESSDHETGSEYDDEGGSEDERLRAVTEAKEWALNSSQRSSMESHNGSRTSSRNSSKKIQEVSHSSSHNSYRISSRDESVSSRDKSNMRSRAGSISISRHEGSGKSKDGSVPFTQKSSLKSHQDVSFSYSRKSSSKKSHQDKSPSLSRNSSIGSLDGSCFSIAEGRHQSEEDESVYLNHRLSHKSSTRSQTEIVSLNHNLSRVNSRGSQDGSVSSRSSTASSRSEERRLL